MTDSFRLCVVIPVYNHHKQLRPVLEELMVKGLPVILVDDGSDAECRQALKLLALQYSLTLFSLPLNQGKGAAVVRGFLEAWRLGYTHVLQLDADGQHDQGAIAQLVNVARAEPGALVTGVPEYDESIPAGRKIGRYVTHFWVWVNTLSFTIKDSMMGFRVYPLEPVRRLLADTVVGQRMDFDTDIMVRMFWEGVPVRSVPVKVIYPEDGLSHFQLFHDNVRISKMHSKLFFGMLLRLPGLLLQRIRGH